MYCSKHFAHQKMLLFFSSKPFLDLSITSVKGSIEVSGLTFSSTLPHNKGFSSGFDSFSLIIDRQSSSNLVVNCQLRKLYSFTKSSCISASQLRADHHTWNTIIYCDSITFKVKIKRNDNKAVLDSQKLHDTLFGYQ